MERSEGFQSGFWDFCIENTSLWKDLSIGSGMAVLRSVERRGCKGGLAAEIRRPVKVMLQSPSDFL